MNRTERNRRTACQRPAALAPLTQVVVLVVVHAIVVVVVRVVVIATVVVVTVVVVVVHVFGFDNLLLLFTRSSCEREQSAQSVTCLSLIAAKKALLPLSLQVRNFLLHVCQIFSQILEAPPLPTAGWAPFD